MGRVSGIVVDVGFRHTRTVAVHDGFALAATLQVDNAGGKHVTQFLQTALSERGHKLTEATCDGIKLKHARCAVQYGMETRRARDLPLRKNVVSLPDATLVDMTDDLLRCAEVILRPSFAGVAGQGVVSSVDAVMRACYDHGQSPELHSVPGFVLAVGGSSRIENLGPRLQHDVNQLQRSVGGCVVSCLAEEERQHAAWIGGSLLSCLPEFFEEHAISSADYHEVGKSVVLDKC
jgi:actin-related protein